VRLAPVDPELREAFDRLAADLRGEIRSSNGETRAYVDGAIQASAAETRRHFDVVGESLRADIRGLAEGMILSSERSDTRFAEQTKRSGGLEGRVLRLEVRVTTLERDRKPRRRRRRP
jgi:hypothetical protein